MQITTALKVVTGYSRVVEKPLLLEEQFDGGDLNSLEQMVDQGDARLEVSPWHPFTHRLVTQSGDWWLVIVREAK